MGQLLFRCLTAVAAAVVVAACSSTAEKPQPAPLPAFTTLKGSLAKAISTACWMVTLSSATRMVCIENEAPARAKQKGLRTAPQEIDAPV